MTVCTMYNVTLTPNNNGEERLRHTHRGGYRDRHSERENEKINECANENNFYM